MAHILVTGSTDGLGRGAAEALLDQGHHVVVHARSDSRGEVLQPLVDRGARLVVADLSDRDAVTALADELNALDTPLDAVIHNAGLIRGAAMMPVNVVAPYLLTALVTAPTRHVYLSSGMHKSGTASVLDGVDWTGSRETGSYSDSKLFVTAFSAAVARLRPDLRSNAVDPGWVATKMGGAGAPDDFDLGHRTQRLLALGELGDVSGAYWFHEEQQRPHDAVGDEGFQAAVLEVLARETGVTLPQG
jgi:NAD(P)-dependent dehydrogenase (short-subunit alcohol dehydrogenase family)